MSLRNTQETGVESTTRIFFFAHVAGNLMCFNITKEVPSKKVGETSRLRTPVVIF
jgi:predicted transcriptional regulator